MLALDHLVIAAKDPLKSAEQFAKKYHVKVVQGGKHDMWGTHNALAYFENNCYIEWLGVFDEVKAKHAENPLIKQLLEQFTRVGEGIFQYGLRTSNMDSFVNRFTDHNISFIGPLQGERYRPDGTKLTWRMLFPQSSLLTTPFLIEWGQESLYGADPSLINNKTLNMHISEKDDLNLFHHIYQTYELEGKISLQNVDLLLSNKHLHIKIND